MSNATTPALPWLAHYDRGVPAQLELRELSPLAFLRQAAQASPENTALVFQNTRLSYAELWRDVARCASVLEGLGAGPEVSVALQMPNLPQTVIAYYAALACGARVVFTNPLYMPEEILHQWQDAEVRVAVVADYLYAQKLEPLLQRLPACRFLVASIPEYLSAPQRWIAPFVLRRRKPALSAHLRYGTSLLAFRPSLARAAEHRLEEPADVLERVAVLQYTGGTTGVSKAAELTHRNLSANVQQCHAWFSGGKPLDGRVLGARGTPPVMLCCLPLFHVFGMTVSMNWALAMGGTCVLVPDPRDTRGLARVIEARGVTFFPAVPAMFNAMNQLPDLRPQALASLEICMSGSAPLPGEVKERFEARSGARILEGYGLTETSPVTHVNPLEGQRKSGSIGIPISNTRARVLDANDPSIELGPGQEGELALSGPQVMRGYWKRPDESAKVLVDGWFRTGDLAVMDEQGYFRIVGRMKDMIIVGGYKVYPDEVDECLLRHAAVLEAATIGVPDAQRGESVKSFVVFKPGRVCALAELEAHCRSLLAAYKVPREFEVLSELPKSSVLKVLRRELRARELARRAAAQPS